MADMQEMFKKVQNAAGEAVSVAGHAAAAGAGVAVAAASGAASAACDAAAAGAKAAADGAKKVQEVVAGENGFEMPIDEEQAGQVLDTIYKSALDGVPKVSRSVDEMVADYMADADSPEEAAKALAKMQVMKCGTSGFVTGLGGLITLPVAIPANVGSVLYVQMRMIAAIAKIGGYDVNSDQVQTLVYMCLTGTSVADVAKQAGIKLGEKSLEAAIKKIPGSVLTKINQKMGFRFITKFGQTGIVNLGKLVPVAGGVIGGGMDVASTSTIAKNAIKMFIKGEDICGSAPEDDEIIDVE